MAAEVVGAGESELLQQLERAQARIDEIRRHLQRAEQVIARPINGQDGEGAVEIALGAGGSVEAVHLDPDWRELVGEQGLAAAVAQAYLAGHGSRLSDWCGALRESLGARGRVPLRLRAEVEPAEHAPLAGPDPDLLGIATDGPDEQVAAAIRAALDRAATACTRGHEGADPADSDVAPPTAATPTTADRISAAFGGLSAAIDAAPAWLDITLVVAGPQTALGMLREVTDELRSVPGRTRAADERLARGLEDAAARARSLLGIPEATARALAAVADLVTVLRGDAEGGPRNLSVG